ncbi:MAG: hypothetical protein J7559_12230 [Cohnella sp.]|nr:hypothetical protein [Cohnella sp.]
MREPEEQSRPEWAERLKSDRAFPGRTFTADRIARIERIALSGESGKRVWRPRLGAMGAAACAAALTVWFVAGGPFQTVGGNSDRSAIGSPRPGGTEPTPSSSSASKAHRIYLKGPAHALPMPRNNVAYTVFEATTSESYEVLDVRGEYIQIKGSLGSGWIPSWYSNGGESTTSTVRRVGTPYSMIVDKPVAYRIYPGQSEPSGERLEQGRVVQVIAKFEEWVEINVIDYDFFIQSENKWIRADELIPYEDGKAKEGYVPGGSMYDETGASIIEDRSLASFVFITGEQGDRYEVTTKGPLQAFIDKKAFVPDPFSLKLGEQ